MTLTDNLKIYVAAHKPGTFPNDEHYVPIHCGKALAKDDLGLLGDDTGENISSLNPHLSELTALYWLWKNDRSAFVGLVHYRRYFAGRQFTTPAAHKMIAQGRDFYELDLGCNLILPTPYRSVTSNVRIPISIEQQYTEHHHYIDLALAKKITLEKHPSYATAWDDVMKSHAFFFCNMFVAKRDVIEDYCEWLFDILFTLRQWLPRASYDAYQARVLAFLAERLFNVWITHNVTRLNLAFRDAVWLE